MLGFIIHLLNIEEYRIQSFHVAVLDGITHFYILYIPVIRIAPIAAVQLTFTVRPFPKKINHLSWQLASPLPTC